MLKFGYLNTSYGQKKGWESNCQFDSQPLKVRNHPNLLMCKWCATCHWKAFDEGYNFVLDLTSNKGLNKKVWASKVTRVPISRISGLPTCESWDKDDIWVLAPWPDVENTLRGKVVASPKSGSWWMLWVYVCSWFVRAPKVLQLCINELVVWFV
jgi:hypothetical protein